MEFALESMQHQVNGLQTILRRLLQQNNPGFSIDEIEALLASLSNATSAPNSLYNPYSSSATHVPNHVHV